METSEKRKNYHKLVRDNIPQIIEKSGRKAKWSHLCKEDRREALLNKLNEEVDELLAASEPASVLEEAADIYETLLAIVYQAGFIDADLVLRVKQKRREVGSFDKFVWLENVE